MRRDFAAVGRGAVLEEINRLPRHEGEAEAGSENRMRRRQRILPEQSRHGPRRRAIHDSMLSPPISRRPKNGIFMDGPANPRVEPGEGQDGAGRNALNLQDIRRPPGLWAASFKPYLIAARGRRA